VNGLDGIEALTEAIGRYNDAWNAQDLDAIVAMHAPDMVFANHTAGESASGTEVRAHIGKIFASWPEMRFETRRCAAVSSRCRRVATP
jgi:ketosteroid isomerase-like protein